MSRNFTGIPSRNYVITNGLQGLPISLCTPMVQAPRMVPVTIDWKDYFQFSAGRLTSEMVVVNLSQGVVNPIDRILSIYVDNSASNVPIFVNFPDTGFTVTIGAGDTVWSPVITGQLVANIIAKDFADNTLIGGAQLPTLKLFFCNVAVSGFSNAENNFVIPEYKASDFSGALFPGTDAPVYRAPALGDTLNSTQLNLNAPGASAQIFPTRAVSLSAEICYLTSIDIFLMAVSDAGGRTGQFTFRDPANNIIATFKFQPTATPSSYTLYSGTGLQLRYVLSPAGTYNLRTDAGVDTGFAIVVYSYADTTD